MAVDSVRFFFFIFDFIIIHFFVIKNLKIVKSNSHRDQSSITSKKKFNHIFPVCVRLKWSSSDIDKWIEKYGYHTVFCLFKIYYFCSELECHSKWIDISWYSSCLVVSRVCTYRYTGSYRHQMNYDWYRKKIKKTGWNCV